LHHLLLQQFGRKTGTVEHGEMVLRGKKEVLPVPSGGYCWWLA
jgi:23S rRNA (cytosine1962-C5)-methyltransferase